MDVPRPFRPCRGCGSRSESRASIAGQRPLIPRQAARKSRSQLLLPAALLFALSCSGDLVRETTATLFPTPTWAAAARSAAVPSGQALPSQTSAICAGRDPKANIYHPARLELLDPCKTVAGTVATIRHEADGDLHIGLRLDQGQEALINAKNRSEQSGNLIVEIICADPVTQADAVASCANYTNTVPVPAISQHVSVTGPYVLDLDHGWNEIHPAWSITTAASTAALPSTAPTAAVSTVVVVSPTPPVATPAPSAGDLCGASANPWGYTFCGGSLITSPPSNFCTYFSCIANFWNGAGYVVQCGDATFSKSGGRSGSCSRHGGNYRSLYAP